MSHIYIILSVSQKPFYSKIYFVIIYVKHFPHSFLFNLLIPHESLIDNIQLDPFRFFKISLFWDRSTQRGTSLADSLPRCLKQPLLCWAGVRSLALLPGLPGGQQGTRYPSHQEIRLEVVELELRPALCHGMWASQVVSQLLC